MVEHVVCNHEVSGSIPLRSTNKSREDPLKLFMLFELLPPEFCTLFWVFQCNGSTNYMWRVNRTGVPGLP